LILYVNGDSHSAGAEAVNSFCFAEDDPLYYGLGRRPHPDNERASYGCLLANHLYAILHCDAESASSNDRIMRTTLEYLETEKPDLVVIGWATWEREEWLHEGTYYQVTASGWDTVPAEFAERYRNWVIEQGSSDAINRRTIDAHNKIYQFHQLLNERGIRHLFFSTFHSFANIKNLQHLGAEEYDWNGSYLMPYTDSMTYYNYLTSQGFPTVGPKSYHLGWQAHEAWADFLLPTVNELLATKTNTL